jgi:translocation and assembly module TamB
MRMLAEFGAPPLLGELTGAIDLEGPLSRPVIQGGIRIAGLEMDHGDAAIGRPADVTIDLSLGEAGLATEARIDGLGDGPVTLDFRLPMRLSLLPFAVDLPETLPLDGRVTARSRLEPLVALAALDGQQVEGDLDLDLRLDGTVARPLVTGRLDIRGGRLIDAASGVVLNDRRRQRGRGDR